LRSEIQLHSVLTVRIGLLQKPEHSVAILCGPETRNPESEDELAGVKGVCLLLSMLAQSD
jgi:hypothetical protein